MLNTFLTYKRNLQRIGHTGVIQAEHSAGVPKKHTFTINLTYKDKHRKYRLLK